MDDWERGSWRSWNRKGGGLGESVSRAVGWGMPCTGDKTERQQRGHAVTDQSEAGCQEGEVALLRLLGMDAVDKHVAECNYRIVAMCAVLIFLLHFFSVAPNP